jgi:hypothetical protein
MPMSEAIRPLVLATVHAALTGAADGVHSGSAQLPNVASVLGR